MMLRLNRRAQSILEYAILIFVVVAALIAIQIYVKRGIQGRMRSAADDIGEQYSPGHTLTVYNTDRSTTTFETFKKEGGSIINRREFQLDTTNRTGSETVANKTEEYWPNATAP